VCPVASLLLAASTLAVDAAELHTDTFQSGTLLGWTSGAVVTLEADGGPAGEGDAFIQVAPLTNLAVHNSTAIWTGDLATLSASTITVDLMNAIGSDPLQMRVVLFGPDTTDNRWTSAVAASLPADGVWRSYSFSLAEADVTRVLGSGAYAQMMADVVRVMLRHDPGSPSSGGTLVSATLGVDNVRLAGPAMSIPGDYTGDGNIDQADYDAWVTAFGTSEESPADGNEDGVVGAADYVLWRNRYEENEPGQSAHLHLIPEPSAVLLTVASAIVATFRIRWRD
jgi:hypothetical protein